jgi:DNA polymerase elongation subunit (family B)
MISENLSHDSKVWTKEFDLAGNLIEEWGYKDSDGNFIYDNLPEYEYVDVQYDTYRYFRKHPKAAAEKTKCGYKICRFAQFADGESAIMPAILKKLLKARKDTRKMIPNQTDEFMKQVLEQRQLGYKVSYISTQKDPKCYNNQGIATTIRASMKSEGCGIHTN